MAVEPTKETLKSAVRRAAKPLKKLLVMIANRILRPFENEIRQLQDDMRAMRGELHQLQSGLSDAQSALAERWCKGALDRRAALLLSAARESRKWSRLAALSPENTDLQDLDTYGHRLTERVHDQVPDEHVPDLTFASDDGTLDSALRFNIYIPGSEADFAESDIEVPWKTFFDDDDCAVLFVMGQSNAANHGEERTRARHEVYSLNFLNMTCLPAHDPLAGGSGDGGSVWPRLGDLLIEAGMFKRVLFIPVAVGGAFIDDWLPEGPFHPRFKFAMERLRTATDRYCVPMTAVLWHQGEAEANHTTLSATEVRDKLRLLVDLLREEAIYAPVFLSRASHCKSEDNPHDNAEAVRKGQQLAVEPEAGILSGPDTDQLTGTYRYDDCHFSKSGQAACADLWFDALVRIFGRTG